MPASRSTGSRTHEQSVRVRSPEIKVEDNNLSKAVWVPHKLGGECPQLTGLSRTVQDLATGMVYVYGGIAPGDKREVPTPYFHVCDTKTMKFTDLTVNIPTSSQNHVVCH
jgi:hypothetical protein